MKGFIFNVQHFCVHDGPGIRTTVFMKGCPLRCRWCFNPESQEVGPSFSYHRENCRGCQRCLSACEQKALRFEEGQIIHDRSRCLWCGQCAAVCANRAIRIYGREYEEDELLQELLQDRKFYETSGGGVTFSGGEVLMQAEFVGRMIELLHKEGISVLLETAGYGSWDRLKMLADKADMIYYDVKLMDEQRHVRETGKSNELILSNLAKLRGCRAQVTVRIPIIWSVNDGANIFATADHVRQLGFISRIGLLPYKNIGVGKYADLGRTYELSGLKEAEEGRLAPYAEYIEGLGLKVEIGA